jgi:hypothetical protein
MVLNLTVVAVDVELHELHEVDAWLVVGEGVVVEILEALKA